MEPFVQQQSTDAPEHYLIQPWTAEFPQITAGFAGRNGGVSPAPYRSLNLGLHVGDDPAAVVENRQRLALAAGVPLPSWIYGEQVHDCQVQLVSAHHAGRGTLSREDAFPAKDAFVTNERGIVLAALFADCVPLYFLDPEHSAAGLAHGGWRGTVLGIASRTVQAMSRQFGTRPQAVRAAIGPSIGACCYEVEEGLISRIGTELGMEGEPYFNPGPEQGKFMLNLQEINRKLMIEAGILPQHIEMSKLCTGCNPNRFFSHRMEQGRTGRMAAWIGWKEA